MRFFVVILGSVALKITTKPVTTQPRRAASFESLPSAASEEFFVSFENAQRFQNSQSPSFQAAKPRFTKKAPAAEQLPKTFISD